MPMVKKSISVTVQQNAWLKAQIETGYYGNESEVIRELIRERQLPGPEERTGRWVVHAPHGSGSSADGAQVSASAGKSDKDNRLEALDKLQNSVQERQIDLAKWIKELKAERQATGPRRL